MLYNSFNSKGWLDRINPELKGHFEVFMGDIRDPHGVKNAVHGCDAILHLAALIAIPYSYHSPETYVETNVKGTLNVLQAARECEVTKIVHTSTSEVYGSAQSIPINENHPLVGQSPYSATKIAADQLAHSFYASFDLPVTTIRPFNTYGPRQSVRAVIPTIITQIAAGAEEIHLGNLDTTRDFNYVMDTVSGFCSVLKSEGVAGEVINIGSSFEVSIGDTAKMIAELMAKDVDVTLDKQRLRPGKSEVERLCADNTLAAKLCGWTPEHGGMDGFREGLRKTIDWYTQEKNLKLFNTSEYVI